MATDIEIARAATLRPIGEIAARAGLSPDAILPYGRHVAKVSLDYLTGLSDRPDGLWCW